MNKLLALIARARLILLTEEMRCRLQERKEAQVRLETTRRNHVG